MAPRGGGFTGVTEFFNEHGEFMETVSHINGGLGKIFDECGIQGSALDDSHLENRAREEHNFGGDISCSLDNNEGRKAQQN